MSGGHWDYAGLKLEEILTAMGTDTQVTARFPILAAILVALGPTLRRIEHEVDWDLSCDRMIGGKDRSADADLAFELHAVRDLIACTQPRPAVRRTLTPEQIKQAVAALIAGDIFDALLKKGEPT